MRAADAYRREWAVGTPDLVAFLAGRPTLTPDELLDCVETDRAERWRRDDRVPAETYLRDFSALRNDPEAALVIIYGEYYLRKDRGETPSITEYIARFPKHARRLRDQVMWHEAIELGTGPAHGSPPEIDGLVVEGLLGRGGMCSVWRATESATGETLAVKLLDREHLKHPQRVARFRREVNSLLRLSHPHIVAAQATGEADGVPYLLMEHCPGGTLAARLCGRPATIADAERILGQLADAVAYAHREGVIHRDLKPGNVLMAAGDVPKVADFGLAKVDAAGLSAITATRETLGTPCYMAPELATGARDADERTDVYGLGAILYELLTGRPPFVAATPLDVVRLVREELPMPPSWFNSAVPPALETVCLRCLAKEPVERFASASELTKASGAA